jgi:hypothetical protein
MEVSNVGGKTSRRVQSYRRRVGQKFASAAAEHMYE